VEFFWGVGLSVLYFLLQIDSRTVELGGHPRMLFELPEQYVFLHSSGIYTDILWATFFLYVMDFTDWSAHRLNHSSRVLWTKFPFGHFVHHNMIFVNPFSIASSPLIHFASITAFTVYAIMLSQGLVTAVFIIHFVKVSANLISHLGCDPLPWLSRLNYRVGGWIPWIPLHHQYHHVPGVRGNYGNLTSLWDHVFGTLSPEYVQHVTTGVPAKRVADVMSNSKGQIDRLMLGRTRFNIG